MALPQGRAKGLAEWLAMLALTVTMEWTGMSAIYLKTLQALDKPGGCVPGLS